MRRCIIWLVVASICRHFVWSFSVHDDLFAFPQYEVVFSDKQISEDEAKAKLALGGSAFLDSDERPGFEASQSPGSVDSDISTRSPSDKSVSHNGGREDGSSQTYERMILKNHTYLCSIPQPRQHRNETKEEVSPEEEEKELLRATDRGWELLKGMKGNCMYYQSGWWSYSFCYQTEVKQFHPLAPQRGGQASYPPVEDTRVPSFILGEFQDAESATKQSNGKSTADSKDKRPSSETSALAIRKKGDTRYMVQQLSGGTTCDLTGKPRKVEVQFHCHPQSADRIGWIKETATCSYLMVIYTPRLCNDVAFLPPKEHKAAPIVCSEVVSDSQLAAYHAQQASRMEDFLLGGGASLDVSGAATPIRPVVGGIEVGGMKLVGAEGQRIAPPQVVEQVPTHGDVIARWDPNRHNGVVEMLTDEDLQELGLDPDLVDQTKDEIHREADGRPWKLEVVDMGGGVRELIGVVETGDEEDDHVDDRQQHEQDDRNNQQNQDDQPRQQEKHGRKGQRGQKGSKEHFKEDL